MSIIGTYKYRYICYSFDFFDNLSDCGIKKKNVFKVKLIKTYLQSLVLVK